MTVPGLAAPVFSQVFLDDILTGKHRDWMVNLCLAMTVVFTADQFASLTRRQVMAVLLTAVWCDLIFLTQPLYAVIGCIGGKQICRKPCVKSHTAALFRCRKQRLGIICPFFDAFIRKQRERKIMIGFKFLMGFHTVFGDAQNHRTLFTDLRIAVAE